MLTPLDIESKVFKKSTRGYNVQEVDDFMKVIVLEYEKLYKNNLDMSEKIEKLENTVSDYRTIEDTLKGALVIAERTAEDVKNNAYTKADNIEHEARIKADKIVNQSKEKIYEVRSKIDELMHQYETYKIQMKQYLTTQMDMLNANDLTLLKEDESIEIGQNLKCNSEESNVFKEKSSLNKEVAITTNDMFKNSNEVTYGSTSEEISAKNNNDVDFNENYEDDSYVQDHNLASQEIFNNQLNNESFKEQFILEDDQVNTLYNDDDDQDLEKKQETEDDLFDILKL